VRREQYVGSWLPEPLTSDPYDDPERAAELADSVSIAALVLLERLTPLERAVFVLREVFAFDFPAIAAAVGRSEAACRQIAVRARRHMDEGRPRFDTDRRTREQLASRFFDALRDGDVESLQQVLTADIQLSWDAGGKAPQWPQPVAGVENAARVLASLFPRFLRIGGRVEPRPINGQPGAIMHDERDRIVGTIALDILDGQVQAVRMVVNPDKLTHLGPVADAWEVVRAVYEARRDPDA
jgi:RNA polymerase sigma-70 factor (ECF subfamily)